MTATPEPTASDYLHTALHWTIQQLGRVADDWEATADNGSLHTPPAVAAHAAATAQANRTAAAMITTLLGQLDAPGPAPDPGAQRPYTRDELLYAITRGDAESYVEEQTGFDDERVTPQAVDAFAAVLKRTIDLDPGWGERLETCCEVAWERFVNDPDHPERTLLTRKEETGVIDPFKEILEKHADAQGWDADTREHVLLQFVANAENVVGTASDLDLFLTDLTADPDEAPVDDEEEPRLRCYAHLEQLQEMLTSGGYDPSREHWLQLDALLGDLVSRVTTDSLLEAAPRTFYVALSIGIPTAMGALEPEVERAIKTAFTGTPGTTFDGSGSGMGAREFFGKTTAPAACAEALAVFMTAEDGLSFRRLEDRDA